MFTARRCTLPLLLLASLLLHPPALAQEDADLEARLDRIARRLQREMASSHTPGAALAVVKDGKVILERGFGTADLETGRDVDEHTRFAIGSTTKAMTATIAAQLDAEGVLSLDEPAWTHLPEFRPNDPILREATLRDLLSHRSGLANMDLLWYGNDPTAEQLLGAAARAQALHPRGERFNYNNVGYLAAGEATARAAEAESWTDLLRRRVLEPLGMNETNASHEIARRDPGMAPGYTWLAERKRHERAPFRRVDALAPAGAVHSSVHDMAKWLRLLLAEGELDGRRLFDAQAIAQTRAPHVEVGADVSYGLGWMIRPWRDRPMYAHGGGIDGYTAYVSLLPEEGLGYVLLTNRTESPLAGALNEIVYGSLLDPLEPDAAAPGAPAPAADDDVIGEYVGNFGAFEGATFEVLRMDSGAIGVDVPGQMVYELRPPDEEGRRAFALTDTIWVRFNRDDAGRVYSLTLHQNGIDFEMPRRGATYPIEIDLEAAEQYLGSYHAEQLGMTVEVLLRNHRLAVDVPGQMVYETFPPDDERRWVLRATDAIHLVFGEDEDEDGRVDAFTMIQEGRPTTFRRVDPDDAGAAAGLPTVDEVWAKVRDAHGVAHAEDARSLHFRGSFDMPHAGVAGPAEQWTRGEACVATLDRGEFGVLRAIVRPDRPDDHEPRVWIVFPADGPEPVRGEEAAEFQRQHPLFFLRDWRDAFDSVRVEGRDELGGEAVLELQARGDDGRAVTILVDEETGVLRGVRRTAPGLGGVPIVATTTFEDHRPVGGLLLPHRIDSFDDVTGRTTIVWESIKPDVEVPTNAFDPHAGSVEGGGGTK